MKKYLLVDTANMFFRARHVASRNSDTWEKIGMALHLTLNSVNSVNKKFGSDHVVFCLEGRSWRKDVYEPYKKNRAVRNQALTEAEQEENEMFWETYEVFTNFLIEKTNCSVLRQERAEADDLIARFIALHPHDHHYIISTDSDFVQLIAENVHQYNGMSDELITPEGYFNHKGVLVENKKTKELKTLGDPQYHLFEKCIRGDTSDNIFSAYPGVRSKSTKKSIGLIDAYADRTSKGFNWNNLMLQRWTDHNGVEHRVLDDYERNRSLIDLTQQPQEIKDIVDEAIRTGVRHEVTPSVGFNFLKFCGKYELTKLADQSNAFGFWLNAPYKGVLDA